MKQLVILILIFFSPLLVTVVNGQIQNDNDSDGINDDLEYELAKRFTPEWRFNKRSPGSSQQNRNEEHFPSSVQWFYDEVQSLQGSPLRVRVEDGGLTYWVTINDINNLDATVDPFSGKRLDDSYWTTNCYSNNLRMEYPEKINGDPDGFPTYYNCRKLSNGDITISFFLFYPFDYKGKYVGFVELGKHKGDWEGINITLKGINNYNDPGQSSMASIDHIFYSGHGHQKYILPSSNYYNAVGDHPRVYISWGSHTCYPSAGSWHDWKLPGWQPDWYDDHFRGDGLVVQSWDASRELINVGEKNSPLVGWLRYKGWWGPDDSGANSSPPGPLCKGFWKAGMNGRVTWEHAIQNWSDYWDNPPNLQNHSSNWNYDQGPNVVTFSSYDWQGNLNELGPGQFPDLTNFFGNNTSYQNFIGDIRSMFVLGNAKVTLYFGTNFSGLQQVLTSSTEETNFIPKSMIIEDLNANYSCDQVVYGGFVGYENGTWTNPYNTISEGLSAASSGDNICVRNGTYTENIYINKNVILRSYYGSAIIGN